MRPSKYALLNIVISIVFAVAIILSSYLLKNTEYVQYSDHVTYLLLALWFVPFSFFSRAVCSRSL